MIIKKITMFVVMIAVAVAVAFSACAETETVGDYTWTYQIFGDTAEISGISPATGAVTIPCTLGGKPVTSIGNHVFSGCSSLTSVTIPDGVTSIGEMTFNGCSGLTGVNIPNSVTNIGASAFSGCSDLTRISIPGSVMSIGEAAFSGCSGLEEMTLPFVGTRRYVQLQDDIFWGRGNWLFGYIFGSSPYEGGTKTRQDFNSSHIQSSSHYRDYYIPSKLRKVVVSDDMIIGTSAFYGCRGLTSVTIGNGVTTIGENAFYGCSSLTSVTIPDSVTSIDMHAFYGCAGITNVLFGSNISSIGESAFRDCSSMPDITVPNSVTNIGYAAFSGCSSLTNMTLPFVGVCRGNGEADLNGGGPYVGRDSLFGYVFGRDAFPGGVKTVQSVGFRAVLSSDAFYIPSSLRSVVITDETVLASGAFSGCGFPITSGCVPNTLTVIGDGAFCSCSGLERMAIPYGVTSIGVSAFENCTNLVNITIPNSVTTIDSRAFVSCSKLKKIAIPSSVTRIILWDGYKRSVFRGCDMLDTLRLFGDAPECASKPFEGASPIVYVSPGTTGWDGNHSSAALPEKWNDCDIKYAFEVRSFRGAYDGYPHGITIDWGGYIPDEARVTYANNKDGPYGETPITYTDIGEYVVWSVVEEGGYAWTNLSTITILEHVSRVSKTLTPDSFVYSGRPNEPTVFLKDKNVQPNLNVTAYAPGDVDGDGVLSQSDVTLIQRDNAYQALSDAMKETFASYNLTGRALVAADVNGDGVVNADDVAALNEKFNGYKMVEGTDYTLAYSDNVNVGTGKVTITGKGKYGGTAVLEFTIAPATIGTNGEPGYGVVPEGGISKHDTICTYDGLPHTVNTNTLAAVRINGLAPSIGYSLNGMDGWQAEPFVFTNVCVTSIWYRLQVPNYADYVHEAQLMIVPKSIADRTVTSIISYDPSNGTGPEVTLVDQAIFRWQFVPPYSAGDVNGDRVLMDDDVMLIEQYLAYCEMDDSLKPFFEDYDLTGGALSAADYNGDGVVDSEDADALEVSFYTLAEGVDYTVSVSVNVGLNVVSVTGLGNYSDSICQGYKTATPFAPGDVAVSGYEAKYDGTAHGIGVTVASGIENVVLKYAVGDGTHTLPWGTEPPTLTDAGSMTVWCEIAAPGYITQTNSATVTITKRAVTLTSGDASKVYDGFPVLSGDVHISGDGFVTGEGATFNVTGSQTSVGTSENAFTYTLNEGTKAGNYDITTVNGTLTVTKATVGPGGGGTGGGDEPGGGEVPQGGESKFDITAMYDGEGHTVDTNALTAAFGAAMIGEFAVEYAKDDGSGNGVRGAPALPWGTVPDYTNAGEYVVWYRVSNPNYNDFIHAAKVTITNRPVTVTSADGSWTYDGQAHSNATVMCEGFVSGEGIVANNFATITDVGSAANSFTYAFADGTLAGNYLVTCVTGTLTISEAYKAFVIRCEWIEDAIRPATMDFMVQTNGVDWQIENVTAVDEWKRVTDVKVYDQGVSIDYGLVALPAEGIRSEIEQLGCRTVGSLSGLDNVLTESGWSNVGSSTINTVVGTVDGWRRFGELRMSDLVIAEDTSKGVFFKVCNFKSTFDIDDGTDGTGGEASRFSYSGVYDGVGHGIGVEVANAPSGMTVKYARGNAGTPPSDGWSAVNPLFTNVCDRAVVWYAVECAGYVAYTNSATVTISPKGVTVRADAKSRPYGQPDVPLTYTAEGLVAGDALGGALSRDPGEAAGTYSIRQGTLANANYAINYIGADYVIAKVSINPQDVFGGNGSEENPLVCEKVYDGSAQSVEIKPNFIEEYLFLWSLTKGDETSYSETAPTLRNVADGDLTVYFKFVTENYEPYCGKVVFRILPKELTDEMVQLTDEAFFFDPESGQKTPSVTVADTNSFGTVISTAADYDVAYGDSTSSAGAVPVTVKGKNNYTGTVTKTFDVLKRPVPPPVIGAKAYNGKHQTATIPVDERWMVVKNDGGINVGEYPVILRLVNSDDYMWKGSDGKSSDWTGVFRITRGANGWSRAPGIANWTEGETPSEPSMGTPRRGTTSYVTYRKCGADVSTAVREQPSRAGKYTARFVVEETENYVGTFRDVDFEILPGVGGFTETHTTPVPVPYVWLEKYLVKYGKGDYETAGHAKGENDVSLWESYVAGLDPEDAKSKFMAKIGMGVDGKAVVTWTPDLSKDEKPRKYTTLGKEKLGDDTWLPITDANKAKMRFFKVTVEMK